MILRVQDDEVCFEHVFLFFFSFCEKSLHLQLMKCYLCLQSGSLFLGSRLDGQHQCQQLDLPTASDLCLRVLAQRERTSGLSVGEAGEGRESQKLITK